MTGPQHRPSPGPRGADADRARPSPRPRHGFDDHEFPEDSYQGDSYREDSYQGGGYPDLRSSRPVERATPTDPEGFGELYGGTGPQPTVGRGGYAAPMRYEGYGAPVQAGGSQTSGDGPDDGGYDAYARAAHRMPEEPATPARAAYGEYGDPESRGGTSIDGGPPYPATSEQDDTARHDADRHDADPHDTNWDDTNWDDAAPTAASAAAYGRDEHPIHGETGGTAVAERTTVGTGAGTGAGAVPVPRSPSESGGRRPATVAEAAAARFGASARTTDPARAGLAERTGPPARAAAPAGPGVEATGPVTTTRRPATAAAVPAPVTVARDGTALTVLRVVTYVLVSLSCLVFLAGAVYGLVAFLEFRTALGTSPLFGGGTAFGN
ncbi:hypothetical protein [Pseudonocardia sp. ICBG601]|uniref:hypothetical protein n=1 Tax=Pseudonocardia sp. ICBG601 TaxID=2846759 RepID=UPI001CF69C01|nr:hypothetical protein [Pseudonocardia sp. ICBG601]